MCTLNTLTRPDLLKRRTEDSPLLKVVSTSGSAGVGWGRGGWLVCVCVGGSVGVVQPVVEDALYCCKFSLGVWLHHPAFEGKCVITNKEVGDISVTTWQGFTWWQTSFVLLQIMIKYTLPEDSSIRVSTIGTHIYLSEKPRSISFHSSSVVGHLKVVSW